MTDKLCWVDIETTGLDPEGDFILEVGIEITGLDLKTIDRFHGYIDLELGAILPNVTEDFVWGMHKESGLWADLDSPHPWRPRRNGLSSEGLVHFYKAHFGDEKVPMWGSSVHFDRAFLKEDFPEFEALFSHRNVDVSSFKEVFKAHGWTHAPLTPQKKHRVLPDIQDSIDEFRAYREACEQGVGSIQGWVD